MLTILIGGYQLGVTRLPLNGFVKGNQEEFISCVLPQIVHHMRLCGGIHHSDQFILRVSRTGISVAYVQTLLNE